MDDTMYDEILCFLQSAEYPLHIKDTKDLKVHKSEKKKLHSRVGK